MEGLLMEVPLALYLNSYLYRSSTQIENLELKNVTILQMKCLCTKILSTDRNLRAGEHIFQI